MAFVRRLPRGLVSALARPSVIATPEVFGMCMNAQVGFRATSANAEATLRPIGRRNKPRRDVGFSSSFV